VAGGYLDPQQVIHGYPRTSGGEVTVVDYPGARQTIVTGLNDRSDVVGVWYDAQGVVRGFLRDGHRFRSIEVPGASGTVLSSINDDGQVAGGYVDSGVTPNPDNTYPPNTVHGLVWDDGTLATLDFPGSTLTGALDRRRRAGVRRVSRPPGPPTRVRVAQRPLPHPRRAG
jgi:hypothetical protein